MTTLRQKIETLPRRGIHSLFQSTDVDGNGLLLSRSEVLAAVEEWEAEHKILLNPNRFDCPECGQGVAADVDGCCATCGRDCDAYEDGVRVVTAERNGDEPGPPVGQAGGVLEMRAGLPPLALRKAWPQWLDTDGDVMCWDSSGEWFTWIRLDREDTGFQTEPGQWNTEVFEKIERRLTPYLSTWSAVEILAARALGEEDGKAGREPMEDYQLARALHGGRVAGPENRDAYRTAYAAAKGTRASTGNEFAMDRDCPSEHCWFCTGQACRLCGAGCWDGASRPSPGRPKCEHDVTERHQEPERAVKGAT